MKRQVYRMIPRAGNLDRLRRFEEDLQPPGEEEVTIKVKSIGLNFADIFAMFGLYSASPEGSFIPGLEYSGEILKTGKNVNKLKQGDRIMGVTRFGGYVDHLTTSQFYVTPLPEGWTLADGAAFPVQALTAYYALIELADIKPGQTVLIHSGAGGVGILANRIAKKYDAYTIGTTGSNKKVDILKKEGYNAWIVRSDNFREDLWNTLEDRELNIVLECIGGQIFRDSFRVLAPEGRMIVYGAAHYATPGKKPNYIKLISKYLKRPKIDPMKMTEWNKSVMAFNLIHLYNKKEKFGHYMEDIKKLDIGKQHIGHQFNFEDLKDAVRLLQSGGTKGKVVVNL